MVEAKAEGKEKPTVGWMELSEVAGTARKRVQRLAVMMAEMWDLRRDGLKVDLWASALAAKWV